MVGLFLVGGLPTILGGGLGYYYSSNYFTLLFNGVAIGTILYVILPMLKILFRDMDHVDRGSPIWASSWGSSRASS